MKFIKNNKWIFTVIVFSIVATAGVVFPYFSKFYGPLSNDKNTFGLFGDYVGGVLGSTFAFLSFMALLITIHLQHQDLVETRREAKEQKELADDQRKILQLQRFETTFFNMLNQITNIIESYAVGNKKGSDHFNKIVNEITHELIVNETTHELMNTPVKPENIEKHLNDSGLLNKIVDCFNFATHISRILEIIFNQISLEKKEKELYRKILLDFLSVHQLTFLKTCRDLPMFKEQKENLSKLWQPVDDN